MVELRSHLLSHLRAEGAPAADIAAAQRELDAATLAAEAAGQNVDLAVAPIAIIASTKDQRDAIARAAGIPVVPGRTDDPDDDGYCALGAERHVWQLGDRARSVAAHACHDCPLGNLTMTRLRAVAAHSHGFAPPYKTTAQLVAEGLPVSHNIQYRTHAANAIHRGHSRNVAG